MQNGEVSLFSDDYGTERDNERQSRWSRVAGSGNLDWTAHTKLFRQAELGDLLAGFKFTSLDCMPDPQHYSFFQRLAVDRF